MSFNDTDIRWTDKTWNPVHGCSRTSEGCANCYAERVSLRFGHTEEAWTAENAETNVQLKRYMLDDRLEEPNWVFVNSMSDLLHEQVPDTFIEGVLEACAEMDNCVFQVLTKHGPDQDRDVPCEIPENVMLGVSVESPRRRYRLDWLREQDATTRFVSFEPLVEDVADRVGLRGIDWAIIGGESGPEDKRRWMNPGWARVLITECRRQDVAPFFKQHSGPYPESNIEINLEDGRGPRRIEEFPDVPDGLPSAPREFLEVSA